MCASFSICASKDNSRLHCVNERQRHTVILFDICFSYNRRIGIEANEELRSIFKREVHLILQVRVKWRVQGIRWNVNKPSTRVTLSGSVHRNASHVYLYSTLSQWSTLRRPYLTELFRGSNFGSLVYNLRWATRVTHHHSCCLSPLQNFWVFIYISVLVISNSYFKYFLIFEIYQLLKIRQAINF